MKKLFFLLFLVPAFANAQRDSLRGPDINMAVKVNLASPIDVFNFPTLNIGIEHRVSDRVSIDIEGGYSFYRFHKTDTVFVKNKGYVFSGGFRIYRPFNWRDPVNPSLTGFYTGLNFFYRSENHNSAVEYKNPDDSVSVRDYFWMEKSAAGLDLIAGYQKSFYGRIIFDIYFGIGILERSVRFHELQYEPENGDEIVQSTYIDSFFASRDLDTKSGTGLSLSFGVRVGFIIY
jgi:hypothetical protein